MNLVNLTIQSKIATITLNRPQAANALSIELLNEYLTVLGKVEEASNIAVVLLTGAGEKAFCAGADLKERKGMDEEEVLNTVALIGQAVNKTANLKQPVIAVLNGVAFGGGLELALACDLRIAAFDSKVGLTETSLGIIPGAGGTQRLPRIVGLSKAKELIYTARRIAANEALEIGLVEYVYNKETLLEESIKLAKEIAANAPLSLVQAKVAIDVGMQVDIKTALSIEKLAYERLIPTADRVEGLLAFEEKRPPKYQGI